MADVTTVRDKIQAALDEELRVVNTATATLQSKIQDALSEINAVISPSPDVSSTVTFTEGTAARVSVAGLMPVGADRYHGGFEVTKNGYVTDGSELTWIPGVYFDPATQEYVYDGSPMSGNAFATTPSIGSITQSRVRATYGGYYVGYEQGSYNPHWSYPPTQTTPPAPTTVGGKLTSQSIYGESKHTRAIYCPWDQKLRVYGGDYAALGLDTSLGGQDGRMLMWKVDPTTNTWTLDYPDKGRVGEAVPLQSDRMNMDWDTTRQIFWISHGSPRPSGTGGYFANNVIPAGSSYPYAGYPAAYYWKGDGGVADAYPEHVNDNEFPVFVYDPKGTTSFRLARPNNPLLCPWNQSNSVMMGTCYDNTSKRWYGMMKGGNGVTLFWLDTTNWESSPDSLAWQTLQIDLGATDPLNLTGKSHKYIYGPATTPMFVDDTKRVAYFWDVMGAYTDNVGNPLPANSTNPALLALTLSGHPQGEHRVIAVADLSTAIGYDIPNIFTGLTSCTVSPFVWIPEKRCIVWMNEPDEENVGPWTRSLQIDVDTGTIIEGPRYPNSDADGMPYHPNTGVWFPPTSQLFLFGLSIMTHNITGGNRSWDVASETSATMPKAWNCYQWSD